MWLGPHRSGAAVRRPHAREGRKEGPDAQGASLSRRTFLGASAGAAATVALGRWVPSARASERLVPPGKLGIQLFTVRDQIPRLHNSVTDTNPANPFYGQPLPGGFRGVFEALASFGYKTVEFAGYTRAPTGPSRRRRSALSSTSSV